MRLERELSDLAEAAIEKALDVDDASALLRPTQDRKHGDYQINGCMALAKKLKKPPRELATAVAEVLAGEAAIEKAEVAGPGFINLTLESTWLTGRLQADLKSARLGVPSVRAKRTVIDYSSPNIAKQMHVGHLRSTVIGDAIARILRFVGHDVIADNHLGDWGTQYGLLIVGMNEWGDESALDEKPLDELERVYKLASARAKEDEAFADAARQELAKLQAGDETNRAMWKRFVAATRATLDVMYARLDVHFDEWLGESAYHDMLPGVVDELLDRGIARIDDGAVCVFFHDQDDPAGVIPKKLRKSEAPLIVRKRDGAYLYGTTDIATVKYRKESMNADASLYVVDQRQAQHFSQVFATARLLGIEMEFEHIGFGTILGDDGTPLRTRDGSPIRLKSLLDEAEAGARAKIEEGRQSGRLRIADEDLDEAVATIGIGAVKYADLAQNRATDYTFDFEKMISFSGDAAPYLQYQYARCRSIFRKAEVDFDGFAERPVAEHELERELAQQLARFGDVVHRAADTYLPHVICEHLFRLAQAFSRFYTECPVIDKESGVSEPRLALVALTARQLKTGLGLLGIGTLERM
ncbi:MAG: arginine--tRNA ligase [Myxococcota bacterium]